MKKKLWVGHAWPRRSSESATRDQEEGLGRPSVTTPLEWLASPTQVENVVCLSRHLSMWVLGVVSQAIASQCSRVCYMPTHVPPCTLPVCSCVQWLVIRGTISPQGTVPLSGFTHRPRALLRRMCASLDSRITSLSECVSRVQGRVARGVYNALLGVVLLCR